MKPALKILAAPVALLLALTVALCSFLLSAVGFISWLASTAVFIGGLILLFTKHIGGGIAFIVIAFLVSPYGIPALAAWLLGILNTLRYTLRDFVFGK